MSATIRDVARHAGVSHGTVSRVINGNPRVRGSTRQRVMDSILELDYVPSAAARRLSSGRTQTIAVIVPFLTSPSVVERLRGIEQTLARVGYDLIVINAETAERRDRVLGDLPRGDRADGIIIISLSPHDAEVARIEQYGLPVVLLDAHHRRLPRIVVDDIAGGRMATTHLLDLGHVRIGYIGDAAIPHFGFTSSHRRERGTDQALRDRGLRLDPDLVRLSPHGRDHASADARSLLALEDPPTAIVCASDLQALGALEAARVLAVEVPGDLSIVGFDDIDIATYARLTTVRQPLVESGRQAAELLFSILAGSRPEPLRRRLPLEVVPRSTTAAPAKRGRGVSEGSPLTGGDSSGEPSSSQSTAM